MIGFTKSLRQGAFANYNIAVNCVDAGGGGEDDACAGRERRVSAYTIVSKISAHGRVYSKLDGSRRDDLLARQRRKISVHHRRRVSISLRRPRDVLGQ